MLLELAAANAAFAVIKEAVQNSGDIMAAGESLFKYFDNKAEIQKRASAKGGSDRGDLEEFMALYVHPVDEEQNQTGNAPINDWPVDPNAEVII